MRLLHFEALKPICPACRLAGRENPLSLASTRMDDAGDVRAGVLRCTDATCGRAFPIVEGTPILVPDVVAWLAGNLHLLLQRDLETPELEDLIGAAVGPDAAFNIIRQQQASYGHDHYADLFEPPEAADEGIRQCVQAAIDHLPGHDGPVLDIGCAVGRSTLDLAASRTAPILGIDLNWPLLKVGREVIEHGRVSYPHRRSGIRYERRCGPAPFAGRPQVDFWIADALALPFRDATFAGVVALNVLDCVTEPRRLIAEAARVLDGGGGLVLATPFDWASHATPAEHWLDGPETLAPLIAAGLARPEPDAPPVQVRRFDLPWTVRLHDQARMRYRTHFFCATSAMPRRMQA